MTTDPIDQRIRDSARRFGDEVGDSVDLELALGSTTGRRPRRPAPLLVALVALGVLAGGLAIASAVDRRDGDVEVAIDEDPAPDARRDPAPDVDRDGMPAPIALGGPTDGKDSVGLPVKVEPATGLVDGQTVTVTGTGFPPGQSVGVVMCAKEAGRDYGGRGAEACNLGRYGSATSSSDGTVVVEFQVQRLVPLDGQEVDCASEPDRCLVGMGLISDYDQSGGAIVSFDPDAPLPDPPTVELSRSTGLVDGEEVGLRVTGLLPDSSVGFEVCDRARQRCGGWGALLPPADGDGVLDAPITLWRAFGVYVMQSGSTGNLDCALEGCALQLYGETVGRRMLPSVDIDFDPSSGTPEPPVARLLEPGPFGPGASIPIEVTGLRGEAQVDATICSSPAGVCFGGGGTSSDDGVARIDLLLPASDHGYPGGGCEGCVVTFTVYPLADPGGLRPPLNPDPLTVTITG